MGSDKRVHWKKPKNYYEGDGASKKTLIVVDHQPCDEGQVENQEAVLQLSGHTHAGQLFPLQFIYRLMGLPAYGEFENQGKILYVSAGAGTWGPSVRTEVRSEWELITLEP